MGRPRKGTQLVSPVSVGLTSDTLEKLEQLAEQHQLNRSDMVTRIILDEYQRVHEHDPVTVLGEVDRVRGELERRERQAIELYGVASAGEYRQREAELARQREAERLRMEEQARLREAERAQRFRENRTALLNILENVYRAVSPGDHAYKLIWAEIRRAGLFEVYQQSVEVERRQLYEDAYRATGWERNEYGEWRQH